MIESLKTTGNALLTIVKLVSIVIVLFIVSIALLAIIFCVMVSGIFR